MSSLNAAYSLPYIPIEHQWYPSLLQSKQGLSTPPDASDGYWSDASKKKMNLGWIRRKSKGGDGWSDQATHHLQPDHLQKPRTDISMLGGRGIGNSTGSCAERAAQAQAAFSLQRSRRLRPIICWTISNLHRGSQRQPGQEDDGQAPSGAQSKRLVNECKLPLIT